MSKTCIIALKLTDWLPSIQDADWIGADKGALILAEKGIRMKLAIGDFDSVEPKDNQIIAESSEEVIRLNPIKDDSDAEAAVEAACSRGYEKLILIGALGGRADHAYANLLLAERYPGRVILLEENNRIQAFAEGTYHIQKEQWHYFSFFDADQAEISLTGFKYPLDHHRFLKGKGYVSLGLSNEILGAEGILTVHHGKVLMIASRDA